MLVQTLPDEINLPPSGVNLVPPSVQLPFLINFFVAESFTENLPFE